MIFLLCSIKQNSTLKEEEGRRNYNRRERSDDKKHTLSEGSQQPISPHVCRLPNSYETSACTRRVQADGGRCKWAEV